MASINFFQKKIKNLQQIHGMRQIKNLSIKEKNSPLNFTTNDYLKLSHHPYIIKQMKEALDHWGIGSNGSRLLGAGLDLYQEFERELSLLHQSESSLLLNSGFIANSDGLSCLLQGFDKVFLDKLCHASIIDGVLQSKKPFYRYAHLNFNRLEEQLKRTAGNVIVITETIFSMDGDNLDLESLWALQKKYQFWVYIDQAHSFGAYPQLFSSLIQGGDSAKKIIMGNFGKALGGMGAFITAPKECVQYLINTMRGFIYSTMLSPIAVVGAKSALEVLKQEPHRFNQLQKISQYTHKAIKNRGLKTVESNINSHICPLIFSDNQTTLKLSHYLNAKGIEIIAIRPPTVPVGTSRLRLSLNCELQVRDIDCVLDCIESYR